MSLWDLSDLRKAAKQIREENRDWPDEMRLMKPSEINSPTLARSRRPPIEIWRSRRFMSQVFDHGNGMLRVSVNRAEVDTTNRRWRDGITWDDLMLVKREIGRGHFDAVEILPRDLDIVNVANMRHIWVYQDELIPFAWRKGEKP